MLSIQVSLSSVSSLKLLRPHLDLKLDNILFAFEDQSVIKNFIQGQRQNPMARKLLGNRVVYRCHNNFGAFDGERALKKTYPKITDFGLAVRGDQSELRINPIQPDDCHAPEVLLGTGWSYSADIWNFGIMVCVTNVLDFGGSYMRLLNPIVLGLGTPSGPAVVSEYPRRE